MKDLPSRKSKRIGGFDYSASGSYFITICTNEFKKYFGEITRNFMNLNHAGCMIYNEWFNLEKRFPSIRLREFVVMPNHVHGVIELRNSSQDADNHEGYPYGDKSISLGDVVGTFKSKSTIEYIRNVELNSWQPFPGRLWQKNYYEHIIRNEKDYERIAEYIMFNPLKWLKDDLFR